MTAAKYRAPDGTTVEVVSRTLAGDHGDGQWYVVRYPRGYLAGECRTVEGLAALGIDLATLEEITGEHR